MECFADGAAPVNTLDQNFRFPAGFVTGAGSLHQKATANLDAIRLLQAIERDHRPATEPEKQILARYSGWGALPPLFHWSPPSEWRAAAAQLKQLLSDAEYTAARASTPNAHYTSTPVSQAIWEAILHFGATAPANILEPSIGIGHFFGGMPDSLRPNTVRVGVELDSLSARFAQLLYPGASIREAGFESVDLPHSFFDLAIGNVPFGSYPVFDARYAKQPALTKSIHDYFLVKSVDLVRPGGLLARITSRYSLDKQNSTVRRYIALQANLIAALRLPDHTFRANAGKDHFSNGHRQRAMAAIATGNYDAIIVSFRSFEFLPLSNDLFAKFLEDELATIDQELELVKAANGDHRRIVKQLETAKKRLKVRFEKRANRESKDDTVTFEDLGITQLMVDEADAYKNLAYVSKMQRIAGLPNSDSFRAFDMFLKIRYIQQSPLARGVVFATGTPISNTLAEMYTVLRYLAPALLEATGTDHFDAWAANFAEAVTALELAPDGSGYRMNNRFARFINMPELLTMFRTVADIQTAQMLQLPRPELETGRPIVEATAASATLKQYIQTLVKRAEALKREKIDRRRRRSSRAR